MEIKRTIPLVIHDSKELVELVREYNRFQRAISEIAYNNGKHLSAISLHHATYYAVEAALPSQMKCSAIRGVAAAYASAKANRRPATRVFSFKRQSAIFLWNRNFNFTKGKLSISTSTGRQKFDFAVPVYARESFERAVSYNSLNVSGTGKITLCLTLTVPEPKSIIPVGIDLGVNNALVASTTDATLFVSGKQLKIANQKTRKTRQRLQKKLSDHKAQTKDTHSVRRLLKRLGRKHSNRSRTFCRETAAKLCKWAPKDSVLVFEDLRIKQTTKKTTRKMRTGTRRKLSQWFYRMITQACVQRAERDGIGIAYVNPAYTSQRCRKCGSIGTRDRHHFSCACGHVEHADVNASHNIRLDFTVLRSSGLLSISPEARSSGKLQG